MQQSFAQFGTSLEERVEHAIELLRLHEPPEGYYLAFSGGKDSCVCKKLCQLAEVKFDAHYNNTTIDPPELVRFIKRVHPDVHWNNSPHGNMMHWIANVVSLPPSRNLRSCCREYKEGGGHGRVKVMGVRAAESPARRHNWREVAEDMNGNPTICVIVNWSDEILWEFIREYDVPYCELYDQGFKRIGCVGCFLNRQSQAREFLRYPNYERNWKRAIIANWEKWKDVPNTKTGEPRYHAKFKTGEDFWQWWLNYTAPDVMRDDCQSGTLWTNE